MPGSEPFVSAEIAGARQREMRARRSGSVYRVFIARPLLPAPPAGYPVIYLLDANAAFGTLAEAVRMQSARPQATGVSPAVVVGIGYPTELPLDYTPDVDRAALSARPDGSAWPPTGGAEAFLDFIETELKSAIAQEVPIDPARQILFGHSFGGLFTLYALFHRPGTFQAYIAGSPSIWFGDRAILRAERAFTERASAIARDVRVMIAVGALEQTLAPGERDTPGSSQRIAWIGANRMVDNAREMAGRLAALAHYGVRVAYEELEDENHVSVIPAMTSRALRFALGRS